MTLSLLFAQTNKANKYSFMASLKMSLQEALNKH